MRFIKNNKKLSNELNIIYFVDAKKTRSFKIGMGKFIFVAIILTLMLLWSITSTYVFYVIAASENEYKNQLKETLATIFEYQSRFDNVYENAYPSQNKKFQEPAQAAVPLIASEALDLSKIKDQIKQIYVNRYHEELETNLILKNSPENIGVHLEDPVLLKEEDVDHFDLSFAIRNLKSPLKAEGFLWASALFVTTNGEKFYIGAPDGIFLTENGLIDEKNTVFEPYSIRYYKSKSFSFFKPEKIEGFITQIHLGILNKDKSKKIFFDLSVHPEIDSTRLNLVNFEQKKVLKDKKATKIGKVSTHSPIKSK